VDGERNCNVTIDMFNCLKTMFICRFLLSIGWLRNRWCRGVRCWSLSDRIMSRNTDCYLLVIKSIKWDLYCVN